MKAVMFERKAINISKIKVSLTFTTLHNLKMKREEEKIFDNLYDNSGTVIQVDKTWHEFQQRQPIKRRHTDEVLQYKVQE